MKMKKKRLLNNSTMSSRALSRDLTPASFPGMRFLHSHHGGQVGRNDGVRGFTLLELLVVIGIIGVLVALGTVAYSSAQISGRNARRKQDLVAIQSALEQYYSENSYSYPKDGTCKAAAANMKSSWPIDPNTDADYVLKTGSCGVGDGTTYCICAVLEPTGGTATSGNSGTDCAWIANKTRFCIGNLQ